MGVCSEGRPFFREFCPTRFGIFSRTVCGQGLPQREKERELAQEARDRRVEGEGEKERRKKLA